MIKVLSIILLIGLVGNTIHSSIPHFSKDLSEWNKEIETEKENNESEKSDADIDEVWTNHSHHLFQMNALSEEKKISYGKWSDILQALHSPPPEYRVD
jgi:hypothetical protein